MSSIVEKNRLCLVSMREEMSGGSKTPESIHCGEDCGRRENGEGVQ